MLRQCQRKLDMKDLKHCIKQELLLLYFSRKQHWLQHQPPVKSLLHHMFCHIFQEVGETEKKRKKEWRKPVLESTSGSDNKDLSKNQILYSGWQTCCTLHLIGFFALANGTNG